MSRKPKKTAAAPPVAPAAGAQSRHGWWVVPGICVLLAFLSWMIFGWTTGYGFIAYDDNAYVYENPDVVRGITLPSLRWALTHSDLHLWTPLTTLSHMVDCQVFGLHPGGHHLTSVLLHIATVVILFLVLRSATQTLWRSTFVAVVFAIHPLRVESVAWIAERKDVLSGFFFVLTLAAYLRYARRPWSAARYALVLVLFAFGLMAKQMLVTVPFVFLLLDWWPLKRLSNDGKASRLLVEKIPFFLLSLASCAQIFIQGNPADAPAPVPHALALRICNALVAYAVYIGKMFYPVKLAVLYPFPASVPAWQVAGAVLLILAVSVAAFLVRRRCPAFLMGWLWYLGMLVPVIGFIQVGNEAYCDRYTYLPQIGLAIAIAWGIGELTAAWPRRCIILGPCAAVVIATLAWRAAIQRTYWKDSEALWEHTLAVTKENALAHNFYGYALLEEKGSLDEAEAQFRRSLALKPSYADAEINLGRVILLKGNADEAILHFQHALQIEASNVDARSHMALAFIQQGRFDEAAEQLKKAVGIKPRRPDIYNNLGEVLRKKGDLDGAIATFRQALGIKPDYDDAHNNMGIAYAQKGDFHEAVKQYQRALEINPQNIHAQLGMASMLSTCTDAAVRDGNKAVVLALQANELSGGNDPSVMDVLAAAYAEAGRFPEAIETTRRAIELTNADNNPGLMNNLESHLALYRTNTPLRQSFKPAAAH